MKIKKYIDIIKVKVKTEITNTITPSEPDDGRLIPKFQFLDLAKFSGYCIRVLVFLCFSMFALAFLKATSYMLLEMFKIYDYEFTVYLRVVLCMLTFFVFFIICSATSIYCYDKNVAINRKLTNIYSVLAILQFAITYDIISKDLLSLVGVIK